MPQLVSHRFIRWKSLQIIVENPGIDVAILWRRGFLTETAKDTAELMPPRYYSGPVSDHFDGTRFFDPRGVSARSRRDLLRWFVDRRWRGTKAKWPAWAPSPYSDRQTRRAFRRIVSPRCGLDKYGNSDVSANTHGCATNGEHKNDQPDFATCSGRHRTLHNRRTSKCA